MAKFTASVPLNIRLPGGFEISGAVGATHRIPDSLIEEFIRDQVPMIRGSVTWITQDEASASANYTVDLAAKYDKTGGTISGAVTATGAISGASLSASGAIIDATITTPALTATAARFKGEPIYSAKAYGVVADGTTDDTTAMRAAIAAAIAGGGGKILMPAGSVRITGTLDFTALKGTFKSLTFEGAGSGNASNGWGGATIILNDHTGPAITAYGTFLAGVITAINGLMLSKFAVEIRQNMGTNNYAVDLDSITAMGHISDVYVYNPSYTWAGGIQCLNPSQGETTFDRVTVRGNGTGIGFHLGAKITAYFDTVANSGNLVLTACLATNLLEGYKLTGPGYFNNGSLVGCKAVNTSDIAGSVGYHFTANSSQWTLTSPHSERFSTGYWFEGGEFNTLVSPLATFPTGTPDALSAGVRMTLTATGNTVISALLAQLHYGVSFEGTARTNVVSGSDRNAARALTAWSRDVTTYGSNHVLKMEGEFPFAYTMGATQLTVDNLIGVGTISPAAFSGSFNNYSPSSRLPYTSLLRIDLTGAATLTGMVATTHGHRVTIHNINLTYSLTLTHGSASSTSTNQFICSNGLDKVISKGGSVDVVYDGTGGRWRTVGP